MIDFTPELRKEALAVLAKYNYGPLFTPPSLEKPTIQMPGMRRRRKLGRRGVRPRDRDDVRAVDHAARSRSRWRSRPSRSPATTLERLRSVETVQGVPALEAALRAHHRHRSQHGRPPVDGADGRPSPKPSRIEAARPPSLGRAARGHVLLTKTLLIIGQEGTTQRESGPLREPRPRGDRERTELRDPRPEALRLRQGDWQACWRGGAAPQRDGRADDLHAERQAIHRRSDRGRQSACGADRVAPALIRVA